MHKCIALVFCHRCLTLWFYMYRYFYSLYIQNFAFCKHKKECWLIKQMEILYICSQYLLFYLAFSIIPLMS